MTAAGNVVDARVGGRPVLVHAVHVGLAITEGPALVATFSNFADVAVVQWETLADAHRDLSAALARVESLLPLPPTVDVSARLDPRRLGVVRP